MTDLLLERFWEKVIVNPITGCWNWTGYKDEDGYGQFGVGNRKLNSTHRFAYQVNKGKIPDGKQLDHLCRNRSCVNPDHLEVVTLQENLLRGESKAAKNARKKYCLRGHLLEGDNLYIRYNRNQRECRKCWTIRQNIKKIRNDHP